MKKKIILLGAIFSSGIVFSQVGINTPTPKATLDVVSFPTDATKVDGFIAPRLKGSELKAKDALYLAAQTGTIVYVTEALASGSTTTKTVNVTSVGYFYFDGSVWQKISQGVAANIYNADGTLTGNRTVTLGGNRLTFQGASQKTEIGTAGTLYQTGLSSYANMVFTAADNNANGVSSRMHLQVYPESQAQIIADNDATGLSFSTNQTTVSAPIIFSTSPGGGANAVLRAQIAGDGRFNINNTLSIGYSVPQTLSGTEKLKVSGSIVTATTTYPDYVFEDYLEGVSTLKPNYKFKSIYDTEKFILENKHLPGVTPVTALEKTENGYSYNLTDLSVQSLEKIEELYLHTIEQQKEIDEQKSKIDALLKVTEKLQNEINTLKIKNL
ncbi:hypothetical protein [Chryseobacterium oryctis]|uniref:Chaperone of endosialidase n=1 Tax=Chryseobacterium oryctis TaxID=2952618 RepID=A0ABT3HSZ1_9FLAO|nr:hypothetical protein [Chryseobacterium oryctis]MCW3162763.1 hypothetical protein [Chryseobacterium oryctis]